jgi:non-specific serine/threonine protein kinase
VARQRFDDAFRLASALVPFWMATKRIDEGDAWFRDHLEGGGTDRQRARALYDHGYLVFWAGRYEVAEQRFVAARALAETVDDPTTIALSLAGSARVALNDDPARAVALLREAMARSEGTADVDGRSSAMHVLGVALQMSGDLNGARDVMAERLELARRNGDEFVVWVESTNLASVERQLGNLDAAHRLALDALAMVRDGEDELAIAWGLNGLAAVVTARGEHGRAATILGSAEAMLHRAGGEWPPDEQVQHDGTLANLERALGHEALGDARRSGSAMSTAETLAYAFDEQSASAGMPEIEVTS